MMNHVACRKLARWLIPSLALVALSGPTMLADETSSSEPDSTNWFSAIFANGEYVVSETYVGEADVRRGEHVVQDFDESDTILRFVATPRTKFGVLRLGAEWERFSFGMPAKRRCRTRFNL